MIGCGGIVDLSEYLSLSHDVSVWVFDNNRPYNLRNVFTNSQVSLFIRIIFLSFIFRLVLLMMVLFRTIMSILKMPILH